MVEWLSDWLEQSATTGDLTGSAPIAGISTQKSKTEMP
jgi:hypothetical protein